ncbi:MAG: TM2 domain-containing protein [Clostridia bacterium]|nr:TM2 domain-containing protein [Clostridia bacterium]
MTPNRVQVALEKYGKRIPADSVSSFKKHLKDADNDCMDEFMFLKTKSPITALLLSIFLGGIGVDRFYLGDKSIGVAKIVLPFVASLISFIPVIGWLIGGLASLGIGIWKFVDIFLVFRDAKRYNYHTLSGYLTTHQKNRWTPNYSYDQRDEEKRTNEEYTPLVSNYEPVYVNKTNENTSNRTESTETSDDKASNNDIAEPIAIKNTDIDVIFTCPVCSQKMRITTVASKYCCPKCSTIFPYKNVVKNN